MRHDVSVVGVYSFCWAFPSPGARRLRRFLDRPEVCTWQTQYEAYTNGNRSASEGGVMLTLLLGAVIMFLIFKLIDWAEN